MEKWAASELKHAQLGDPRRKKRLIRIVEDLAGQPGESVPTASGNRAATTAAYDFWNSPYIKPSDIRDAHAQKTLERIQQHDDNLVLAIQDTTNLDFTGHKATKGLGILDHPSSIGLKVHSCLVVTKQGVPLGLIDQKVWSRPVENKGIAKQRRQKETKDKESQRWLDSCRQTEKLIPKSIQVVTVTDREGDIFDLFAQERSENSHLLIRAAHNRKVLDETKYLHQSISQVKPCGTLSVEIHRNPEHHARVATLTLTTALFEIEPPRHHKQRSKLKPVNLQVILAQEENPPSGIKAISWLLLTTLDIKDFEQAVRCVRWYSYRWLIERYHYALKSGCGIEKLQLETARRIEMALATYTIVAWRLLWLTYHSRINPQQPCDTVLETHEWQSLCATIQKTPKPPKHPPSLRDAIRMIAALGGFLGRKSDGEPGIKTIWRGLRRLHDIALTWKLLHCDSPSASSVNDRL